MKRNFLFYLLIPVLLIVGWFGFVTITAKPADSLVSNREIVHILDRLSYGPSAGDIALVKSLGINGYIKGQLQPESITESPRVTQGLSQLSDLKRTPAEIFREYTVVRGDPKEDKKETPQGRKYRQKMREDAIRANLIRAIDSKKQLQEVMTNFWFNHFNVFVYKGKFTQMWIGNYEEQAIRPHTLGRFRDLLGATARHPAMLFYLDNWRNTDPNSPGARGQFKGINENYARELLELHTLGVDGGYSQKDVISLARILTGWGISNNGSQGDGTGFYFNPKRHDFGDKLLLGTTIKGGGEVEVEQALDLLARHPSTARHISYQLAQYFVADQPPAILVDRLAQKFSQTDGNIRAVLETLFQSQEFLSPQYYDSKFKTPYQYVVSLIRATGINPPNLRQVFGTIAQMGMPIYGCISPDGYKNTREAWLSPDSMIRRISLATSIGNGFLNQRQPVDPNRISQTLENSFSPKTQEVVNSSPPRLKAGLMLGSPEMINR
jgi:uncharacterized protein (DUF1800 family)